MHYVIHAVYDVTNLLYINEFFKIITFHKEYNYTHKHAKRFKKNRIRQLLYNDHFLLTNQVRTSYFNVTLNATVVLERQGFPLDFTHDALVKVIVQSFQKFLIVHVFIISHFPP